MSKIRERRGSRGVPTEDETLGLWWTSAGRDRKDGPAGEAET